MSHSSITVLLVFATCLLGGTNACSVEKVSDDNESDNSTGVGGNADDGKYRPEPDGTRVSETEACDRLRGALEQRAKDLDYKCSATTLAICPNLLRRIFGASCMEYDGGTVDACVTFYGEMLECSDLSGETCVVTPYYGSEPAGCP